MLYANKTYTLQVVVTVVTLLSFASQSSLASLCSSGLQISEAAKAYVDPAVESVPARTTTHFTPEAYFQARDNAQNDLLAAIDKGKWQVAGRYNSTGVTEVPNPEALLGEVIAGVSSDINDQSVSVFVGRVLSVYNANENEPMERPYYVARVRGPEGDFEVSLGLVFRLHVLIPPPSVRVLTGNAPLDAIPTVTVRQFDKTLWSETLDQAKASLNAALESGLWEPAGDESRSGTIIYNYELLKGRVIAGIETEYTTSTIKIFAGKVIEVEPIPNSVDLFRAKISGPDGVQEIRLTYSKWIHVLRE